MPQDQQLNITSALSRRQFLQVFGISAAALLAGAQLSKAEPGIGNPLANPVPPSLMLHSKDARPIFTATLTNDLFHTGYQATTYQQWEQAIFAGEPMEKPVIVSIDDITMAQQSPSFNVFRQMHDWYLKAAMVTVFSVITRPDLPQDESHWDEAAEWLTQGFELATHTSHHRNFNASDTSPDKGWRQSDYDEEIVASAEMIEAKMRARGMEYPVKTLVLPYGSGYSYEQPKHVIHPGIIAACAKTNIKFVVGIVEGRSPITIEALEARSSDPVYVGRTPPAYMNNQDGGAVPQGDKTFAYLQDWQHEVTRAPMPFDENTLGEG